METASCWLWDVSTRLWRCKLPTWIRWRLPAVDCGMCQLGCGDVNYLPGLDGDCQLMTGATCQLGCEDVNYLHGLGGGCQLLIAGTCRLGCGEAWGAGTGGLGSWGSMAEEFGGLSMGVVGGAWAPLEGKGWRPEGPGAADDGSGWLKGCPGWEKFSEPKAPPSGNNSCSYLILCVCAYAVIYLL